MDEKTTETPKDNAMKIKTSEEGAKTTTPSAVANTASSPTNKPTDSCVIAVAATRESQTEAKITASKVSTSDDAPASPINATDKSNQSVSVVNDAKSDTKKNSKIPQDLRDYYEKFQQDHVFKFADKEMLSNEEIEQLTKDLKKIDLERLRKIYEESNKITKLEKIQPLDKYHSLDDSKAQKELDKYKQIGLEAISQGKVGAIVLAGGQGTRLGYDGPKGMYDIGLPSGKSLFQLFAERILKLQRLSGTITAKMDVEIPWYIMTSEMNDASTSKFFKDNAYFGLKESQVFFFQQGFLPSLTPKGKIIMETPKSIAKASDGNGGIYSALSSSGAIADMEKRGTEYLHVFSVDNAICRVVDPVFMGYCVHEKADCGNKVVWKNTPSENVGVVAKRGGKFCVVEYTEMAKDIAELKDSNDEKLVYGAGNICNHFFTLEFLRKAKLDKYHIASKKIPYANDQGETIKPTSNNGIKLEAFIFDVFPLSEKMAIFEGRREDEFSPVKNAPGSAEDSPDTARLMISGQAKRWIEKAGGDFTTHLITSGVISKKKRFLKQWITRFLVFDAYTNMYTYYKKKEDYDNNGDFLGRGSIISCKPRSKGSQQYGFICQTVSGKPLKCRFETEEEQKKWLDAIGSALDPEVAKSRLCEVSPLVSYAGEGLEDLNGKMYTLPFHLSSQVRRRVSHRKDSSSFISSEKMQRALLNEKSGVVELVYDKEIPRCARNQVCIEVKFVTVNSADYKIVNQGMVGGIEASGVVHSIGEGVSEYSIGDKVILHSAEGGCFAEYIVLSQSSIAKAPKGITLREAATIPYAALTAWKMLFSDGKLKKGEKLLVVSSKENKRISWMVMQIAKEICKAQVLGVVVDEDDEMDSYLSSGLFTVYSRSETPPTDVDVLCILSSTEYPPKNLIRATGRIVALPSQTPVSSGSIEGFNLNDVSRYIENGSIILPLMVDETSFEDLSSVLKTQSSINKTTVVRIHPASVPPDLRDQFIAAKQEHVFKYIDAGVVTPADVDTLITELEALDLPRITTIYEKTVNQAKPEDLGEIQPLESFDELADASTEDKVVWLKEGYDAIANGKVAALLLSGGQGTRLGFPGPKGMYNIGLPSGKTLFQLFSERIITLQNLAADKSKPADKSKSMIPFYIMTSQMNDAETKLFFRKHDFFGLDPNQLFFFPQGTLPCLTTSGKIMLEAGGKLAKASDGNGGVYHALKYSGALQSMEKQGVQYVHAFSVDNALCKVADPMFIGYCITKNADCGNKVVWKNKAKESVGVVAKRGGKFCVVEYSEMSATVAAQVDKTTGKLVYGAGNICNHFYTLDFLSNVVLPNLSDVIFHVAHKKIPAAQGDNGITVVPEKNNGIKLEAFIFDVFPLSQNMAVLSVCREDEFSPVKNAPGDSTDSPDTARQMFSDQSKRWLEASGAKLRYQSPSALLEISPLVSYAGENLESYSAKVVDLDVHYVIEAENVMASAALFSPDLRALCEQNNQKALVQAVDKKIADKDVTAREAYDFLRDLRRIDIPGLHKIYQSIQSEEKGASAGTIEPLDSYDILAESKPEDINKWRSVGHNAIASGNVCAVLLSGGQGTRLGFSGPKGMYDIGLPSKKSLFQLFAERIFKLEELSGAKEHGKIPWYIMTSELNDAATREFFERKSYFGLKKEQVFFLLQGTLPCLSASGEILIEVGGKIARGPDGNGGIYLALSKSGAIADMERRGVKYIHIFGVDNALCRVADPVFMGYCIERGADCGNKVVWKTQAKESVGVVAKRSGKVCVIEYSEMDEKTSTAVDAQGKLVYGAGNICNHFFTVAFVKESVLGNLNMMKYHVARKKIPNTDGIEGIKLETFIFDVFPLSQKMAVLAITRDEEFAPVKNAPGTSSDSPDTARELISSLSKRWIEKAGGKFKPGASGLCEVSPIVSYCGEGLEGIIQDCGEFALPLELNNKEIELQRAASPKAMAAKKAIEDAKKEGDEAEASKKKKKRSCIVQ